jgi:hypothetical protein
MECFKKFIMKAFLYCRQQQKAPAQKKILMMLY